MPAVFGVLLAEAAAALRNLRNGLNILLRDDDGLDDDDDDDDDACGFLGGGGGSTHATASMPMAQRGYSSWSDASVPMAKIVSHNLAHDGSAQKLPST